MEGMREWIPKVLMISTPAGSLSLSLSIQLYIRWLMNSISFSCSVNESNSLYICPLYPIHCTIVMLIIWVNRYTFSNLNHICMYKLTVSLTLTYKQLVDYLVVSVCRQQIHPFLSTLLLSIDLYMYTCSCRFSFISCLTSYFYYYTPVSQVCSDAFSSFSRFTGNERRSEIVRDHPRFRFPSEYAGL